MKNTIVILVITLFSLLANGQETKKNKNANYTIEVNGNCEQCQKRIQKAAFSVKGVKSAVWDIETHQLSLIINEEKCSLLGVKKKVAGVGHDTDDVKATDEVFENLHACCKYERK